LSIFLAALEGLSAIPKLIDVGRDIAGALRQANRLKILEDSAELKRLSEKAETDEDFQELSKKLFDLTGN